MNMTMKEICEKVGCSHNYGLTNICRFPHIKAYGHKRNTVYTNITDADILKLRRIYTEAKKRKQGNR